MADELFFCYDLSLHSKAAGLVVFPESFAHQVRRLIVQDYSPRQQKNVDFTRFLWLLAHLLSSNKGRKLAIDKAEELSCFPRVLHTAKLRRVIFKK